LLPTKRRIAVSNRFPSDTVGLCICLPLAELPISVYFQQRTTLHRHRLNGVTGMADYSKFQQKVIKNYYDNQETILLQRLGEHITELYLADGKARAKRWKDITKVLEKLKVPASRIETLVQKDNPAMLAKLLEELLAKQK
jgi:hypothetical protein